ncbi:hypothetical protein IWQ62_000016 [Dispira parvispora]|uniref:Serine hydrolase domain-containing protein n=1 Tax=Dispira parvispora TaxID=1520584 RepID=A0A9W8E6H7_9FUNG|nr:hypothetical protein IWQ62_000016 [Dispira parvispora]
MTQKLRILCLHGYAQNADIFRVKTGATRKNLRAVADLIYVNGPHKVEYPEPGNIEERQAVERAREAAVEQRAWFRVSDDHPHRHIYGLQEGLDTIRDTIEKEGPFDGIMGFSQGAAMAGIVALLLEGQPSADMKSVCNFAIPAPHQRPRFYIMVGGFQVNVVELLPLYKQPPCSIPTLHLVGDLDTIITPGKS